jgi:hypothetical protein
LEALAAEHSCEFLILEQQCIGKIVEGSRMAQMFPEDKTEGFLGLSPGLEVDSEGCGKWEGSIVHVVDPVVLAHNDSRTIVVEVSDFEAISIGKRGKTVK